VNLIVGVNSGGGVKNEGVGDIGNRILIVKQKHRKNIFLRNILKILPPKSNLGR